MGADIIDFTDLQKRGLLKVEPQEKDVVDFTEQFAVESSAVQETPASNVSSETNPFDMLSSLAQVQSTESSFHPSLNQNTPGNSTQSIHSPEISLKLDTIVNKIEDTMYKIENLSSRIAMLESRLGSLKS